VEQLWQKKALLVLVKDHLVFQNVLKSLKNVRYEMWLDGENESFNAEFIHSNILAKRLLISIHTCKVVSLIYYIYKYI